MVYSIDNTYELRGYAGRLMSSFEALVAKHQSAPDVRVAVIAHGTNSVGDGSIHRIQEFVSPDQLSVSKIRNSLSFSYGYEWLDSSIAEGQKMINDECPQGVDLTAKPWCQHKVIVVLSDGDPGVTYEEYLGTWDDDLPDKLLDSVSADGIAVNTICVYGSNPRDSCDTSMKIQVVNSSNGHWRYLTMSRLAKWRLVEMSKATGGKYYGTVR